MEKKISEQFNKALDEIDSAYKAIDKVALYLEYARERLAKIAEFYKI